MPTSTEPAPARSYRRLVTALGGILITGDDTAVTAVTFLRDRAPQIPSDTAHGGEIVDEAAAQLQAYLTGRLREFDLPVAPKGTPHDRSVWRCLQTIPYGTTCSYGDLAKMLDPPGSPRAVGTANGRNPIAIVIPCHRVIGANGKLTGYASGVDIKAQLLDLERLGLIPRSATGGPRPGGPPSR